MEKCSASNRTKLNPNKSILAFCHVAKAAGSTFIYILRNSYGLNYCQAKPIFPQDQGQNFKSFLHPDDLVFYFKFFPRLASIGGHDVRPTAELKARFPNLRFVSFVRDPVERYLSQVDWQMMRGDESVNLEDSYDQLGTNKPRLNYQSKFLTGCADHKRVIEILENRMFFVGTIERFDESLVLLRNLLKDPGLDCRYERINVTPENSKRRQYSKTLMERIAEDNEADVKLYRYINEQLDQWIREYTGDFRADLADFRKSLFGFRFPIRRINIYRAFNGLKALLFGLAYKSRITK